MSNATPVLLDFESRSRADLKTAGGRNYWACASTEALCCAWYDTANGAVGLWLPGQSWPHVGRVLAAHNATTFDRFGAERHAFGAVGWVDTAALARRAGLPGALDELGTRWADTPKDKIGNALVRSLTSVRRAIDVPAATWREWSPATKRLYGRLTR